MMSQVDLAREAAHLNRFIYNFRGWKDVSFPKPVHPLVHPAVLVETYEKGKSVSHYVDDFQGHEHFKSALAHIGTHALLKMLLVDNFIHVDMHPGNSLIALLTTKPGYPESLQQLIEMIKNPVASSASNAGKEDKLRPSRDNKGPSLLVGNREELNIVDSAKPDPTGFRALQSPQQMLSMSFIAIDIYAKLIFSILKGSSKRFFLSKILAVQYLNVKEVYRLIVTSTSNSINTKFEEADSHAETESHQHDAKACFREARGALSRSGENLPSNQSPVKVDSASTIPVMGGIPNYITISEWIYCKPTTNTCWDFARPTSTVQGVPSLQTSSPSSVSQDIMTSNENARDTKPIVSMLQPRPVNQAQANVNILNNLSQARQVMNFVALSGGTSMGLPSMGQIPVTVLIDMWAELHDLDEDGTRAMAIVHDLITMNLINLIATRKVTTETDKYYNNHYVMMHDLLRELGNQLKREKD
ncbi:hypothetical protein KIW84_050689 [Lathyrus oleraceus]|uniref:ABC1 atypical kinase-like domain-containing protein n=1 Tax=Pisum sativum TaxID=3888 RepID=A0A9D5AEY2_PEA|nr:hypothetical protein KIW84_050689 [Pisum sativum]